MIYAPSRCTSKVCSCSCTVPSTSLRHACSHSHRVFDETEDATQPWRGCPVGAFREGAGHDCVEFGNRLSASIIRRSMQERERGGSIALYTSSGAGTIYNPRYTTINCAYINDGGTRSKPFDGCGNDWCPVPVQDPWCGGLPCECGISSI